MIKFKLIITTLFLTAVILSGCLAKPQVNSNQPINQNINQNINIVPTTTTGEIDTSDWKTYRNEEYGFEIKYPDDWVFQEFREGNKVGEENKIKPITWVSFGNIKSKQEGYIWGIQFYHKPNELERDIAQIGNQFDDRREKRKNINFNNIDALFVIVTTAKYEGWISESVYFSRNNVLFRIDNGAVEDNKFEQFYKSFKFTN